MVNGDTHDYQYDRQRNHTNRKLPSLLLKPLFETGDTICNGKPEIMHRGHVESGIG